MLQSSLMEAGRAKALAVKVGILKETPLFSGLKEGELLELAGLTVATAIRIMSRLRERGIIRSARGRVIIIDEGELKLLSEAQPEG